MEINRELFRVPRTKAKAKDYSENTIGNPSFWPEYPKHQIPLSRITLRNLT